MYVGLFGHSKSELLEWQNIIAPNTPRLMWNEKQLKSFTAKSVSESIKMIQESMNLCNKTKKPDVFFKRYDIVLYQLGVLAKLEKFVSLSGDKPGKKLVEVQRNKSSETNKMIERIWEETIEKANSLKTDSAKAKKLESFRSEMDKYSGFMDDSNIDYYESLVENYKQ